MELNAPVFCLANLVCAIRFAQLPVPPISTVSAVSVSETVSNAKSSAVSIVTAVPIVTVVPIAVTSSSVATVSKRIQIVKIVVIKISMHMQTWYTRPLDKYKREYFSYPFTRFLRVRRCLFLGLPPTVLLVRGGIVCSEATSDNISRT